MKRNVSIIAALILGLGISFVWAFEDEWGIITIPKDESIHLGFAAALTGDYANLGLDEQNGVELALEDQGSKVSGFRVELLVENDQCEGLPAIAVAEKFRVNPLFVGVIGHMCSPSSIPASKIYEKYGFSMVSPSTTAAQYTNRGMQNVFRTCFNDVYQGKVSAEYAINELRIKTAAILHDTTSYGQPIAETFKKTFESLGGNAVAFEGITRGDKDFRQILTKIKPLNPQAVYFGGMAAEGVLIVRQMRDIGMSEITFLSDDGCYSVPDFIEGAGDASDGAYISFAPGGNPEWARRFEEKFGNPPVTFAPQSYDATMAMLKAIEAVGKIQDDGSLVIGKKALADAIRGIEFEGVTGQVAFKANGDSQSRVIIWQVVNGKFEIAPGQE